MPVSRKLPSVILLGLLAVPALATPVFAAEPAHGACLTKTEQRAAVASHRAVPLAQAIRSLRRHGHKGEVVRAELCDRDSHLVYVLTLLAHSGKVTRASIDAGSGEVVGGR
jgi:uncharacterized membrane protein YkoI